MKTTIQRLFKLAFYSFLGAGSLAIIVAAYVLYSIFVAQDDGLKKTTILAKIKEETALFYLDEKTQIGSIFESNHRRYVPITEIPAEMINAIIAAEDKYFYNHFGVNPIAIFKAFSEGLVSGFRFKRGGSTITQQTIKNIMGDWERSVFRKFREMIKAFQLERLYSKQQILEFYLNQFHVAGNGNGIGIAAKYYFNKEVQELTLIESAFIAGSIKGPSKYNPFIKYTVEAKDQAKRFAKERKDWVLGEMLDQGWIKKEQYDEVVGQDVPFSRGEFRNAEMSLVELVKLQLQKQEILEKVGLTDAADLNSAGLRVYTTLDADIQTAAQLAMRRNLSRLETILKGFNKEAESRFTPKNQLQVNEFYYGKVTEVTDKEIKLSFGLPTGTITEEALTRYAKIMDLAIGKGPAYQISQLRQTIKPGDILYVQALEYNNETHEASLELHRRPEISGGLVVLDKGEVRAVISGFDTVGYNRAMFARRQPGSVFKSVVYFAALQLGWSPLDLTRNFRQIYNYQGRFYYPRPDHISPYDNASILWSGVMSENLSAVSLGAHLLDKLSSAQFKSLMGFMDLLPHDGESSADYHFRVSKKTGIALDNEGVKKNQLINAINDVMPDIIFMGDQQLTQTLEQMWWGSGYISEWASLRGGKDNDYSNKEVETRAHLVRNNFLRYVSLHQSLVRDWALIEGEVKAGGVARILQDAAYQTVLSRFRFVQSGGKMSLAYARALDEETTERLYAGANFLLPASPLSAEALERIFLLHTNLDESMDNVLLDAKVPAHIIEKLSHETEKKYAAIIENEDKYKFERYFQHYDFRIALGMSYLIELSRACGIYSPMEGVLSFPLGTNDVTASEVAKMYQTFTSGKTYRFFKTGPANQINFIKRIEDRFGQVLYEAKAVEHQLVNPEITQQMREILRKVVTHGTGRRARGELFVEMPAGGRTVPVRIPAYGKTGTTNDFTTSYFAGFMPYPVKGEKTLSAENSYVIANYVGYDKNDMMRRGGFRVYGGMGGLPLWTDVAKQIISIKDYKGILAQLGDGAIARGEWPMQGDSRFAPLLVDLPRGSIIRKGEVGTETWETTNIAKTGENYRDAFQAEQLQSVVFLPRAQANNYSNLYRNFELFKPVTKSFEAALDELTGEGL